MAAKKEKTYLALKATTFLVRYLGKASRKYGMPILTNEYED